LVQWNSSRVFISQTSGLRNGSIAINGNLDWNVTIAAAFSGSPTIRAVLFDDIILVSNGSIPSAPTYTVADVSTFWAFSLKPQSRGQLLWGPTNIPLVNAQNQQLMYQAHDPETGVFMFQQTPDMSWIGYDIYTGQKLWQTISEGDYNPYAYYISSTGYNPEGWSVAYGTLFSTGYVGMVFAYNTSTGKLMWKYDAPTGMEKFEYYTLQINAIADGKIYIGTHEHSADTPLFKGARTRALDVKTGVELWSLGGWANPYTTQVADGVLTYWNNYDHKVYAIGKGPSQTEVTIQNDVVPSGSNVLITGSVIDISAGTKQAEQAARFPNGVPAVADGAQSQWMEYVYMQKPKPTNATGVDVVLSVIDPNNNVYEIGTTTSDLSGTYSFMWEPPVPGKYTVIAKFAGSHSYWQSYAQTAFAVNSAPEPTTGPTPTPASVADMYFVPAIAGIIVAIAIVGALLALLLIRKQQ
jgi:outer membrane protein assembly factor BamB